MNSLVVLLNKFLLFRRAFLVIARLSSCVTHEQKLTIVKMLVVVKRSRLAVGCFASESVVVGVTDLDM